MYILYKKTAKTEKYSIRGEKMKKILLKQTIIIIAILIFNLVFTSSTNAKDSFESINDFLKARRGN